MFPGLSALSHGSVWYVFFTGFKTWCKDLTLYCNYFLIDNALPSNYNLYIIFYSFQMIIGHIKKVLFGYKCVHRAERFFYK